MVGAFLSVVAMAMSSGSVEVVNGMGADIRSVVVRDSAGGEWAPSPLRASQGARVTWNYDDERCAFDLSVTLSSGEVVSFGGVNPCDARMLTLKRNGATGWVDYD